MSNAVGPKKLSRAVYKRKTKGKTQKESEVISKVLKIDAFLRQEKAECHAKNVLVETEIVFQSELG